MNSGLWLWIGIARTCHCKWRHGVGVITIAQLHSTGPELMFLAGSSPARGVSEICDVEDLWQWSRLKKKVNAFCRSTIPQKQFIIIISSSSSSSSIKWISCWHGKKKLRKVNYFHTFLTFVGYTSSNSRCLFSWYRVGPLVSEGFEFIRRSSRTLTRYNHTQSTRTCESHLKSKAGKILNLSAILSFQVTLSLYFS